MIRTHKGEVIANGDGAELLADLVCIVAAINIKTDIRKKYIKEAFREGMKLSSTTKARKVCIKRARKLKKSDLDDEDKKMIEDILQALLGGNEIDI